jgi:hypothetical protein
MGGARTPSAHTDTTRRGTGGFSLPAAAALIAQLAAGDSLVLPPEVVAYLDRLRELGVSERMVEGEQRGPTTIAPQPLAARSSSVMASTA